ncbi:hypothetical protein COT44_00110 [Candidatus Shapirobacteria bacterium CG08_land_8_20_14_0_20_39_18]|uniref:Uncharacterized protein n=1 Tax=Candidatus Shapirobacteria bacterium CG08_land_8_20_14_0_20_39_18 TaxID=1974883 RepID=A0A2M6XEE4_9BACT|nr:MAG: hypothetical protein COT44_00110 [Candidatus Shapirobacteria bacterium CG08_land_8_20_14_0_20_39_18]PIY66105.1 MAG: hypothetical protein COY91_01380 [Candidatus Shapirobacteria bacterium CG_4_10_14_0_8_um_filter_39_15]PJE68659.1 MAG: hypothetical protein COU94_00935 [Candidatus Shapirobacteria bacterium CG10_big_fil_rev_8_21_14_0_10_38_8]
MIGGDDVVNHCPNRGVPKPRVIVREFNYLCATGNCEEALTPGVPPGIPKNKHLIFLTESSEPSGTLSTLASAWILPQDNTGLKDFDRSANRLLHLKVQLGNELHRTGLPMLSIPVPD